MAYRPAPACHPHCRCMVGGRPASFGGSKTGPVDWKSCSTRSRTRRILWLEYSQRDGTMSNILDKCAGLPEVNLAPGTILLTEGEKSGKLYILIEGEFEVSHGGVQIANISRRDPYSARCRSCSMSLIQHRSKRFARAAPSWSPTSRNFCISATSAPSHRGAAGAAAAMCHRLSRRHEAAVRRAQQSSRHGRRGARDPASPAAAGNHCGAGPRIRSAAVNHAGISVIRSA